MVLGCKTGSCKICKKEGKTEWHHIISQHHAKKTGQNHLIYNPNNVVELCRKCHNQTTASKSRYRLTKQKETNQRKEYIEKRRIEREKGENQQQPVIQTLEKDSKEEIYEEITEIINLVTKEFTKAKNSIGKDVTGFLNHLLTGK